MAKGLYWMSSCLRAFRGSICLLGGWFLCSSPVAFAASTAQHRGSRRQPKLRFLLLAATNTAPCQGQATYPYLSARSVPESPLAKFTSSHSACSVLLPCSGEGAAPCLTKQALKEPHPHAPWRTSPRQSRSLHPGRQWLLLPPRLLPGPGEPVKIEEEREVTLGMRGMERERRPAALLFKTGGSCWRSAQQCVRAMSKAAHTQPLFPPLH